MVVSKIHMFGEWLEKIDCGSEQSWKAHIMYCERKAHIVVKVLLKCAIRFSILLVRISKFLYANFSSIYVRCAHLLKSLRDRCIWCNISGEVAGEVWNWSLLRLKGSTCSSDQEDTYSTVYTAPSTSLVMCTWQPTGTLMWTPAGSSKHSNLLLWVTSAMDTNVQSQNLGTANQATRPSELGSRQCWSVVTVCSPVHTMASGKACLGVALAIARRSLQIFLPLPLFPLVQ